MITLTKEQHDAIAGNGKGPIKARDPISNADYVLVPAGVYANLSGMIDVDFHVPDMYAAMDEAFAEGWNHPGMSDYDRYEEFKK
jgi:hypothetical protein